MERYEIINTLIKKRKYKSYLEIGTQHGNTFTKIEIPYKVCVDPEKVFNDLTYEMTSDDFFKQNKETFDIIFVDGLHLEDQCTIDIENSFKVLNKGGTIVVHDCLPHCEEYIKVCWNGTVFRSIINLRYNNPEVCIDVVDTDNGCGIIQRGKQTLYNKVDIERAKVYDYFADNRKELMNVITIDQFLLKYT
jgi:predicted O-methyltransferase YrrM